MASVTTYLNFSRSTEAAFTFYKTVFGGEFAGDISRFGDMPPQEGMPPLPEEDKQLVMHVVLPILGGVHQLMGADVPEFMDAQVSMGNSVYINLQPDTKAETKRLFDALSEGGTVEMDLHDSFWGAYYGSCKDKFGIHWMFNCEEQ